MDFFRQLMLNNRKGSGPASISRSISFHSRKNAAFSSSSPLFRHARFFFPPTVFCGAILGLSWWAQTPAGSATVKNTAYRFRRLSQPYLRMMQDSVVPIAPSFLRINPWIENWKQQPFERKLCDGIIAANLGVYSLWQSKSFRTRVQLYNYFTTNVFSFRRGLPLIGSAFSHNSFGHFALNMYAFKSFATPLCTLLGWPGFLGLYLSSAAFSSYAAAIRKVAIRSSVPSLGASGAIFALFGCSTVLFPGQRIKIIGLPYSTSGDRALLFAMALDALGLLRKWKRLDHSAHLAGAVFGYLWGVSVLGMCKRLRRKYYPSNLPSQPSPFRNYSRPPPTTTTTATATSFLPHNFLSRSHPSRYRYLREDGAGRAPVPQSSFAH
eukprot:GCRY01005417.1.p1 GENE.GCRY01005417.1~~GCRY01005417.1.p1  ORF type:complete len:380 (+),score=51.76 GCRY01005417.1:183-1322(+)